MIHAERVSCLHNEKTFFTEILQHTERGVGVSDCKRKPCIIDLYL